VAAGLDTVAEGAPGEPVVCAWLEWLRSEALVAVGLVQPGAVFSLPPAGGEGAGGADSNLHFLQPRRCAASSLLHFVTPYPPTSSHPNLPLLHTLPSHFFPPQALTAAPPPSP
jgi:hypothetical protein